MAIWRIASLILGGLTLAIYIGGANYWNQPDGWYQSLQKPSWQPPGYIFGIIWPYNFIIIGVALYAIAAQARPLLVALALSFFAASVFFALRWSYTFYYQHDFSAAATSLLLTTILTLPLLAITYSVSWRIAIALVPYQIWIAIATSLNYGYHKIN